MAPRSEEVTLSVKTRLIRGRIKGKEGEISSQAY